jgi:1,4-dihydroxy-2-naphthoate polyprenyltransferase
MPSWRSASRTFAAFRVERLESPRSRYHPVDAMTEPSPISATPTVEADIGRRSQLRRWIAASRPRTLLLALGPVVAGLLLAWSATGSIAPITALATLGAAALIQIGTNLHNDAADFDRGTDTPRRLGPPRASAQGWFTSRQVRLAAHLAFGTAFLLGLGLVLRGGWPILLLGLAAIAAGYAYTSGPRPIAYGPFGELFVLVFFGIAAVAGTYWLQALVLTPGALWLGLALGLPAGAVLLLNNYRDFDTDHEAGRRTLCHVVGRGRARLLYAAALLLAPTCMALGAWTGWLPGPVWLPLLALPMAAWLIARLVSIARGPKLNLLLGRTAQYQAVLVLLLGASVLAA